SVIVFCGSLLPCSVAVSQAPSSDKKEALALMLRAASHSQPKVLLADAGYDADWIHQFCYEQWKVSSYIPLSKIPADGRPRGVYRHKMTRIPPQYRKRWNVESFMSALKRMTDSRLRSRSFSTQTIEALLKVITFALHR